MKIAGIILLVMGILALMGGFMQGHFTPASLAFIVLGAFSCFPHWDTQIRN